MKKTTVIVVVLVLVIAAAVGGAVVALRPAPPVEAEAIVAPPEAAPAEGPFSTEIGERAEPARDADAPERGAGEGGPRADTGERRGPPRDGQVGERADTGERRGPPRDADAPERTRGEGPPDAARGERGQWLRERLTEEQFAQLEKLRADMREAGATREETRAATRELLQSFGVEMPERRRGGESQ